MASKRPFQTLFNLCASEGASTASARAGGATIREEREARPAGAACISDDGANRSATQWKTTASDPFSGTG